MREWKAARFLANRLLLVRMGLLEASLSVMLNSSSCLRLRMRLLTPPPLREFVSWMRMLGFMKSSEPTGELTMICTRRFGFVFRGRLCLETLLRKLQCAVERLRGFELKGIGDSRDIIGSKPWLVFCFRWGYTKATSYSVADNLSLEALTLPREDVRSNCWLEMTCEASKPMVSLPSFVLRMVEFWKPSTASWLPRWMLSLESVASLRLALPVVTALTMLGRSCRYILGLSAKLYSLSKLVPSRRLGRATLPGLTLEESTLTPWPAEEFIDRWR